MVVEELGGQHDAGDEEAVARAEAGLRHASGFLRSELARGLKLRIVPELKFVYDASVERGVRLSKLIDDAVASDSGGTPENGN